MGMLRSILAALALSALVSPPTLAKRQAAQPDNVVLGAQLRKADGTDAGYAVLRTYAGKSTLDVWLRGLTPGEHGLHLHTTGKCAGPDFASAGSHLNPEGHQHGTLNPAGHHMGDLPNVTADAAGFARASFPMTSLSLPLGDAELLHTLMDNGGPAIVVHAGPDDYKTDPSGKSGARIACGVFRLDQ